MKPAASQPETALPAPAAARGTGRAHRRPRRRQARPVTLPLPEFPLSLPTLPKRHMGDPEHCDAVSWRQKPEICPPPPVWVFHDAFVFQGVEFAFVAV